ncbi:MAG: protein-export membrane protein SecF [Epulopiscium sp. Nele67-Bin004]|nr:MAG: protein-export membrane protein SecF [Epulopiscium sp. Nele67-Bin004]
MDFIGKRKIYFVISMVLIIAGLVAMPYNASQIGDILNFDIEFKGGTVFHLDIGQAYSIDDELRPLAEQYLGDGSAVIQNVPNTFEVIITTQVTDQAPRVAFVDGIKEFYGLEDNIILGEDSVSATISPEIQSNAIQAIVLGSILMLIYIWIRFQDIKFGASAVVALIHDVLIMVGVYAIFRIPVNNSFIAAILTIIGYSINDTIIVFDRIRENRQKIKGLDEEIINTSISQTITRSINTSITTLIMVSLLYFFGTDSVREFAFPLVVGVLSGTYSSIFVASPVWFEMRKFARNKNKSAVKA